MITTSYFSKLKYISNPVAITAHQPKWYDGKIYKVLSPPLLVLYAYKNEEINDDEYTKLYYEFVLDKLDQEQIYMEIVDKFSNNATLLCYEKSTDFCHRHLVSSWFRQAGFNVKELEF